MSENLVVQLFKNLLYPDKNNNTRKGICRKIVSKTRESGTNILTYTRHENAISKEKQLNILSSLTSEW